MSDFISFQFIFFNVFKIVKKEEIYKDEKDLQWQKLFIAKKQQEVFKHFFNLIPAFIAPFK